jgi:hypothetical protein
MTRQRALPEEDPRHRKSQELVCLIGQSGRFSCHKLPQTAPTKKLAASTSDDRKCAWQSQQTRR